MGQHERGEVDPVHRGYGCSTIARRVSQLVALP
jgi:hypothetical protein